MSAESQKSVHNAVEHDPRVAYRNEQGRLRSKSHKQSHTFHFESVGLVAVIALAENGAHCARVRYGPKVVDH